MNHLNPASTGVFAFKRKRLFQYPPLFNCNSCFRFRHDFSAFTFDIERLTSSFFTPLSVLEATFSLQRGHSDAQMILKIYDEVTSERSNAEAAKLIKKAFGQKKPVGKRRIEGKQKQ